MTEQCYISNTETFSVNLKKDGKIYPVKFAKKQFRTSDETVIELLDANIAAGLSIHCKKVDRAAAEALVLEHMKTQAQRGGVVGTVTTASHRAALQMELETRDALLAQAPAAAAALADDGLVLTEATNVQPVHPAAPAPVDLAPAIKMGKGATK